MKSFSQKTFDLFSWFVFLIYLTGGIFAFGRWRLGFILDLTRILAIVGAVCLGMKADLTKSSLALAFYDFQEALEKKTWPRNPLAAFVGFAGLYVIAIFFLLPFIQFWSHTTTGILDLGLMEQIIWRNTQGLGLTTTVLNPGRVFSFFPNNHLNFSLFPISWLYAIYPRTETLLFLKSLALLAPLIPLWKIGKIYLKPLGFAPILLPIYYWTWDAIHRVNLWHFHDTPFMPFLGLWSFYFYLRKRWVWSAVFLVSMAMVKEDAWVTAGAIAFYYLISYRRGFWAFFTLALGLAVFFGHVLFLNQFNSFTERYAYLGTSVHDAIITLCHRPWLLITEAFRPNSLDFLFRIFQVGGAVWLLSRWAILGVLPVLFMCALSTLPLMTMPEGHYVLGLGAPLFIAITIGVREIYVKFSPQKVKLILSVTTLFSLTQLAFGEPSILWRMFAEEPGWQNRRCYDDLLRLIPANVPLAAEGPLGANVARRPILEIYPAHSPKELKEDRWVLIQNSTPLPSGWVTLTTACGMTLAKPQKGP